MKTFLIISSLFAFCTAQASAVELRGPATSQLYTCAGSSLSRVALKEPAPCCVGMLGCPQLLANTGLVKPKRDNRT